MMKSIITVLALSFALNASANSEKKSFGIYGWDIQCVGANGLTVSAAQSDDDFYIDFQGGDLQKTSVWADTTRQWDSRIKNLVFSSEPSYNKDFTTTLSIVRENTKGFGYGEGVLMAKGKRYVLNCYVRYGEGEDEFDAVQKKRFPPISEPSEDRI